MKRLVILLVAVTACCLTCGAARAASIGVYFDQQPTTICAEQLPGTQGTAYILALAGADLRGIGGAEFRVDGMPASWSSTAVASAGSTTVGNPLTGGCQIAFSPCQESPVIVLYTVHYTVVSGLPVYLSVHGSTAPSNPDFPCAQLYCDCAVGGDCTLCVPGGTAAINDPSFCLVGVEPRTWSRVKSLYE